MRTSQSGSATVVMLWLTLVPAAHAAKVTTSTDELQCGGARVTAETTCVSGEDFETQCTQQALRLRDPQGVEVLLPHDGRPVKKRFVKSTKVLDSFIVSWACIKSETGKDYLLLAYSCSSGEETGRCEREPKEWIRIFSPDGKNLTAGLQRQDSRYDALFKRLGIAKLMDSGVPLQGINYR